MSSAERPAPAATGGGERFTEAEGCWIRSESGERLLDLLNGFGAVWLGHGDERVRAAAHHQIDRLWSAGRAATPALEAALGAAQALLPPGLQMAGLYSTGMEGMEFALRVATAINGRGGVVAFSRSMHGKSALTAGLAWPGRPWRSPALCTLPFVDEEAPEALLQALEAELRTGAVAAVVVEPVQGSNGGHEVDARWLARAQALCRAHGSLFVLDEILTGLFRCGTPFIANGLPLPPDLLVFGKGMANGLPVSGVALRAGLAVPPAALPGSTFAGNAVVAAAAAATLQALAAPGTAAQVVALEAAWRQGLAPLARHGLVARGRGALAIVELADAAQARSVEAALRSAGVLVAGSGRWVRLLPSLACAPAQLLQACSQLCAAAVGETRW